MAGYASPPAPERPPERERHIDVERPGELVGMDCFFVGRLRGTRHPVWQITAIDLCSSYAWANLVTCPAAQPSADQTSALARRVASDLHRAGWRLERALCDNGNEFRSHRFSDQLAELGAARTHIRAGRPQTNGHVENLHKTILDECWRAAIARSLIPAYTALHRDPVEHLDYYNTDRAHTSRLTRGKIPADIIDPARKMKPRP